MHLALSWRYPWHRRHFAVGCYFIVDPGYIPVSLIQHFTYETILLQGIHLQPHTTCQEELQFRSAAKEPLHYSLPTLHSVWKCWAILIGKHLDVFFFFLGRERVEMDLTGRKLLHPCQASKAKGHWWFLPQALIKALDHDMASKAWSMSINNMNHL